ncbi:MAG: alkaline phosphatase family protein [Saprospiraceae bacterium]|nr:alkaline phosphatase family protein [Saprospiraceae bacterium]
MRRLIYGIIFMLNFPFFISSQKKVEKNDHLPRPKLVIGIVVDQMRWDYLYRYYDRYSKGGFKRLLNEGFSAEQTYIPYAPTVTAAGHTCVYTGSVPAIHCIAGNNWYNLKDRRVVYCSEDTLVKPLGTDHKSNGNMSPANMKVTSICDELKLATNFRSKVVGVCIKDRGAIFPAGHTADAAFWFDSSTGRWISSTHYMEALPTWLVKYNDGNPVERLLQQNWATLYPKESYTQSSGDEKIYEGKYKGYYSTSLPYKLDTLGKKGNSLMAATPWGNTMTAEVAKLALENYAMGKDEITDFLALSFSSPDYVGHQFGPNSIEAEDTYLRLDKELENLLLYADNSVGAGNYTVFLTADHGVAHVPGFLIENQIPSGQWNSTRAIIDLNDKIMSQFGIKDAILSEQNYQLYLDADAIAEAGFEQTTIEKFIIDELKYADGIHTSFSLKDLGTIALPAPIKEMLTNGYNPTLSGHIQVILESAWIDGWLTGTTHGMWYNYDSHIPMVWFGWGIKQGTSYKKRSMADFAPTLAALLKIQVPSGSIGQVVEEALK